MPYIGLQKATNRRAPHLGGNIIEGDPYTFSPNVWNYVIERFSISSILDLGSGCGYSSEYFFRQGMKVLAVDGLLNNIETAVYPTIQIDLSKASVNCKVDFVHCQEVVEHIHEAHLENLLKSLITGKIILITHAVPGQRGYHHVNLKPTEYWIKSLEEYNCHVLAEDTSRIRKIALSDGAKYLAATGTLFANRNRFELTTT